MTPAPTDTKRMRLSGFRLKPALPRLGVLTMVLATGVTALPVVGGHQQPRPRPIAPHQLHLEVRTLSSRPATAADGTLAGVAPFTLANPSGDVVAVSSQGAPMVGVTWPAGSAPPSGTVVLLRGRSAKGWTEWFDTEVTPARDNAAPRGAAQRIGTDPIWLGEGIGSVQIRYPKRIAGDIRSGRLELVQPGTSTADAPSVAPPGSATAIAARPAIISRARWGADETMRTCPPAYATTTKGAFLHHTAGSNSYTAAQSAAIIRGIYAYHVKGQGWCDIGYNFLVDKYGQTFEGRFGGVDRPLLGAHTLGFNTDTFGVSVLGQYQAAAPSTAAVNAVTAIMAWRLGTFYQPANGKATYTSGDSGSRFPEGTVIVRPVIMGHRDVVSTECPGINLWRKLDALRGSVTAREAYGGSAVYKAWVARGGASGVLGPVKQGEQAQKYGVRTIFAHDDGLWQTPSGVRRLTGVFAPYFNTLGGPDRWGYPTGDSYDVEGGSRTDFSGGTTFTWTAGVGTRNVSGPIKAYWVGKGAGASVLRFPLREMSKPTADGFVQDFQGGSVYSRNGTGTHGVAAEFQATHARWGGIAGRPGWPTSEQLTSRDRLGQVFQGGRIYESAATGNHAVLGPIDTKHASLGGWDSWLGLPTADEVTDATGVLQQFEGGSIHYDPATGGFAVVRA